MHSLHKVGNDLCNNPNWYNKEDTYSYLNTEKLSWITMPRHFFGKFSGICVAVLLCLTIHYAQCDSLLRPELVKIALVCLINRYASGLQQVLKKFSESSCSLTQDLASAKEKKNTRRCRSPNKKLICSHLLDGSWWKRSSFSLVYIVPIVNIETRGFKHLPGFTCILSQPSVFLQNLINPYCLINPIEPLSDQ